MKWYHKAMLPVYIIKTLLIISGIWLISADCYWFGIPIILLVVLTPVTVSKK